MIHAFKHKNGAARYTHIKTGRNKNYFTNNPLNGDNKYTANHICKTTEFLADNTLVHRASRTCFKREALPVTTPCINKIRGSNLDG